MLTNFPHSFLKLYIDLYSCYLGVKGRLGRGPREAKHMVMAVTIVCQQSQPSGETGHAIKLSWDLLSTSDTELQRAKASVPISSRPILANSVTVYIGKTTLGITEQCADGLF